MFDAVVLAGTGKEDALTGQEGVRNKAFISLHNRPLLDYILKALVQVPSVDRIAVVGPVDQVSPLLEDEPRFIAVQEKESMLDNLAAGIAELEQDRLCLVVTADIPLITPAGLERFLVSCVPHDHDLYYPVLTRETCLTHFPDTERTYVRLKEGYLTGGNVGLVNPRWFLNNRDRLELFISYRKKPLKLFRILPPLFILKYIFKTLSIADLERFLSKLLTLQAQAVISDVAEIGLDVDKVGDLALVRRLLAEHLQK